MTYWQALILGAIQGLTEFIPVSSSGHLALAHYLFGWGHGPKQDFVFDLSTNIGTLLAAAIYFRGEWVSLLVKRSERRMLGLILLACIPGAIAGKLLKPQAESYFREPAQVALLLAVMGLALWAADYLSKKERDIREIGFWDAVWIGCSQALAIMPGVSRSGATIAMGLLRRLTREAAARYSFLLSLPIIAGAVVVGCSDLVHDPAALDAGTFLIAIAASGITGHLSIGFLLKYLQRGSVAPFAIYRVLLAAVVFVVIAVRAHMGN